jgi:hypothetical protein
MVAAQVGRGEQRDDMRAAGQRFVHAFHEMPVGEVPLLQDHSVAGGFQYASDLGGQIRVGAGPADE